MTSATLDPTVYCDPEGYMRLQGQWLLEDEMKREWTATECARYCRAFFAETNHTAPRKAILPFLEAMGVKPPESAVGWLPERLRLESDEWWQRQLTVRNIRKAEALRLKSRRVTKYVSDELLADVTKRKQSLKEWMKRAKLVEADPAGEEAEALRLDIIAQGSISHPTIRRTELMVRIKGMEQFADYSGHCGFFLTATAASSNHSNSRRYNGSTPTQVQQEVFCARWAILRAALAREEIPFYGLRVAEPHKDGCPHWHMLIWFRDYQEASRAIDLFREHFLYFEGPPEPGAKENRLDLEYIDPEKGSAVAYVSKYISKNVDGKHLEDDHTDGEGQRVTSGEEGARRVQAWAAAWGIRQFQFFGGPEIGRWRELRRIRKQEKVPESLMWFWHAADTGDFFSYMLAWHVEQYRPELVKHTLQDDLSELAKHFDGIENVPDREILLLPTLNKYQEPKAITMGVIAGANEPLITRTGKAWKIEVQPKEQTPAHPQDRIEVYADIRAAMPDPDLLGDVIQFAVMSGLWGGHGPDGPCLSDLWQ